MDRFLDIFLIITTWLIAMMFMLISSTLVFEGFWVLAISFFLTGALIAPPISNRLPPMNIQPRILMFIGIIIVGTIGEIYVSDRSEQAAAIVAAQQKEEEHKQQIATFALIKEDAIHKMESLIDQQKYEIAAHLAKKYIGTQDTDVQRLYEEAMVVIRKREREQQAALRLERQKQDKERETKEYIDFFEKQIEDLDVYNLDQFLDDKTSIIIAAVVYSGLAIHLDEIKKYTLNDKQKQVVKRFRRKLIERQRIDLPRLRDAYGPAARKALWSKDITAKTFGTGYKNIEFVGNLFVTNKSIGIFQTGLKDTLRGLRFSQVRYKWYKEADEYQYFNLNVPSDTDIVVLESGGWYRIIE